MEFSGPFRTSGCAVISPDARLVANSTGSQVVVRETQSSQVIVVYTCNGTPSIVRWSSDSCFLACLIPKLGLVNVFDVGDHDWDCVIDGGDAGVQDARWAPDSRSLLVWSQYGLKVNVWSVARAKLVREIWNVKYGERMISWRKGGGFAALVVRDENGEALCVYETKYWRRAVRCEVDWIKDIAGIHWSPNGKELAVWDGILGCRVALVSPAGYELGFWEDADSELGIKTIDFSPDGTLLALGGYDETLRVLNVRSFQLLGEFDHCRPEVNDQAPPIVYRERTHLASPASVDFDDDENLDPNIMNGGRRSRYEPKFAKKTAREKDKARSSYFDIQEANNSIDIQKKTFRPELSKNVLGVGVGMLTWAPGNYHVATRNDSTSNVIFIWNIQQMRLVSLIVLEKDTRAVAWENSSPSLKSQELLSDDEFSESTTEQPKSPSRFCSHLPKLNNSFRVAIATANKHVYLWSEDGAAAVNVPEGKDFGARKLQWANDNSALLILDHVQTKSFSLMYP